MYSTFRLQFTELDEMIPTIRHVYIAREGYLTATTGLMSLVN